MSLPKVHQQARVGEQNQFPLILLLFVCIHVYPWTKSINLSYALWSLLRLNVLFTQLLHVTLVTPHYPLTLTNPFSSFVNPHVDWSGPQVDSVAVGPEYILGFSFLHSSCNVDLMDNLRNQLATGFVFPWGGRYLEAGTENADMANYNDNSLVARFINCQSRQVWPNINQNYLPAWPIFPLNVFRMSF